MNKERTQYLLVKLMEEAAEVIHAAAKAYRFGLHYDHPNYGEGTNENQITKELADLLAMAELLGVDLDDVYCSIEDSLKRFEEVEHRFAQQIAEANK